MYAKVVGTFGNEPSDILWIQHTGTDLYCGISNFDAKWSYHFSGKLHLQVAGSKEHESWHASLQNFKGYFAITTLAIARPNDESAFQNSFPPSSGHKVDAIVLVDFRVVPPGVTPNISVGLLEPGKLEELNHLITAPFGPDRKNVETHQVHVATNVSPWVTVLVWWLRAPAA